jgi:hypothetical protein
MFERGKASVKAKKLGDSLCERMTADGSIVLPSHRTDWQSNGAIANREQLRERSVSGCRTTLRIFRVEREGYSDRIRRRDYNRCSTQ